MSSTFQRTFQHLAAANNTLHGPPPLIPAPSVQVPQPTAPPAPAPSAPAPSATAPTPPSQLEFINSTRGKPKLVHGGYIYVYHKDRSNGNIAWRCEQYSKPASTRCSAAAVTTGKSSSSTLEITTIHPLPGVSLHRTAKPHKIVLNNLQNVTEMTNNSLPESSSMKKTVQRQRKRDNLAANPDLALACDRSLLLLQIPPTLLSAWKVFDSGPSSTRVIILTTEPNLDFLCQSMRWCGDGTFKAAPELFTQLHGMKSGYTVPCVYALLPNKRKESYVQLFRQVKSWLDVAGRQWSFESFLSDYEQGAYNAVLDVFPGIGEEGSFFHLYKRLDFQVKRLGLMTKYLTDDDFKLRVKMLSALAFVPVSDVVANFESLATTFLNDELPLLGYFESTWIGQSVGGRRLPPMFSHHMWNVLDRAGTGSTRTTNALESFHHSFNSLLSCIHPAVWKLLESLEAQQNQTPVYTVLYTVLYQGSKCRGSRCPTLFPKLDIWTPVSTVLYTVIPGVQMSGVQMSGSRCRGFRCRGSRCRGSRCPIPKWSN